MDRFNERRKKEEREGRRKEGKEIKFFFFKRNISLNIESLLYFISSNIRNTLTISSPWKMDKIISRILLDA